MDGFAMQRGLFLPRDFIPARTAWRPPTQAERDKLAALRAEFAARAATHKKR